MIGLIFSAGAVAIAIVACTATIGLSALIASWLGSVELMPWVFAVGFWVLANLPERHKEKVK